MPKLMAKPPRINQQNSSAAKPSGLRPKILDRIFAQGIPLPKEITMLFPPPPGYKPSAR